MLNKDIGMHHNDKLDYLQKSLLDMSNCINLLSLHHTVAYIMQMVHIS